MKGFLLAIQFLTRLPTPRLRTTEADFAASMRWFPAVGLVIGALVAGAALAAGAIDPWTAAFATLATWVWVTGALHLDGLADLADAGGAIHKGRDRMLAVLADPHVSSFGVTTIVLQLLAKLILLHGLIEAGAVGPLILIPFAARIGPLAWTYWLPALHQGLAARFRVGWIAIMLWALALAAACWFWPVLLVTPLLLLAWGWHIRRSLGGISGDGHGAGIEIVETGLLAALLIVEQLP